MHRKNLIKSDIIQNLSIKTGFSINYSKKIFSELIEIILNNIKEGNLNLKNIGSFKVISKRERVGRNPKTGLAATINARRVITFKPSKLMKERINKSEKQ